MIQGLALVLLWNALLTCLPIPPENYYNHGNVLFRQGLYQEAEREYARVFERKRLAQRALYNAGNAVFEQENYEQAIVFYERALDEDPEDEDTWHNLEIARKRADRKAPALPADQSAREQSLPEAGGQSPDLAKPKKPVRAGRKNPLNLSRGQELNEGKADQILKRARQQERRNNVLNRPRRRSAHRRRPRQNVFTQTPEELLRTMREQTRAAYPYRPGSSLLKIKPRKDEVDW